MRTYLISLSPAQLRVVVSSPAFRDGRPVSDEAALSLAESLPGFDRLALEILRREVRK